MNINGSVMQVLANSWKRNSWKQGVSMPTGGESAKVGNRNRFYFGMPTGGEWPTPIGGEPTKVWSMPTEGVPIKVSDHDVSRYAGFRSHSISTLTCDSINSFKLGSSQMDGESSTSRDRLQSVSISLERRDRSNSSEDGWCSLPLFLLRKIVDVTDSFCHLRIFEDI